jgi:amino acid transporter
VVRDNDLFQTESRSIDRLTVGFRSMARDGCIPFSKFFYQLTGDNHTPFRCIVFQTICGIVVIMPVSLILPITLPQLFLSAY